MTTTTSTIPGSARRAMPTPAAAVAAVVLAAVVSIVASAVVAVVARGAGVSHGFKALHPATFGPLIVIGLIAATIAWALVRARSADPVRVLTRLAPTVLVLSFIPDIAVGASKSLAHTSWGGIVALMVMHLIVAAAGIASLSYFLPLRPASR